MNSIKQFLAIFLVVSALQGEIQTVDHPDLDEFTIAEIWERRAEEWNCCLGSEGALDTNRLYQSDPLLMKMLGDVNGLTVLDVGCGNGYLSKKIAQNGAHVIAVDISSKMIEIAKENAARDHLKIDFRVDNSSMLYTIPSNSIDRIVSNYVLIETPQLEETIYQFYRALKEGGEAVVVILHPCFPKGAWNSSYFHDQSMKMPSYRNISEDFIVFHRPISKYWKVFKESGFDIIDFDEPFISQEIQEQISQELVDKFSARPRSVIFSLRKS